MNFIERLFGISPDGGDGSTELMYLTVLVLVGVAYALRRPIEKFLERPFR